MTAVLCINNGLQTLWSACKSSCSAVFGPAEWRLGIDDPVSPWKLSEALGECSGSARSMRSPKKTQLASREGGFQLLQKQAAEQPRKDADRQEAAGRQATQRMPSGEGPPPRHGTADMRMVLQVSGQSHMAKSHQPQFGVICDCPAPVMEDGNHRAGAEALRVSRDSSLSWEITV